MKVTVNNKQTEVTYVFVGISINKLTREFTLIDVDDRPRFKIGDKIKIFNLDNELLIESEIEYFEIESENRYVYSGRNKARYIVDSYVENTIQFNENQKLDFILKDLLSDYGISVKGTASLPKGLRKTVLAGENLGLLFVDLAKSTGNILISDAKGNIEIEGRSQKMNIALEHGLNIRSRSVKIDKTQIADKYIVISQNDYVTDKKQEVNIKGGHGNGKRKKVLVVNNSLNQSECKQRAKKEYNKDKRKVFRYDAVLDIDLDLRINSLYMVTDNELDLNDYLRLKELRYELDGNKSHMVASFERVDND